MRYYLLTATTKDGQTYTWSSHPNGTYDPGAAEIYFDAFVTAFYPTAGSAQVGIEGIKLSFLEQPLQFVGAKFSLVAGMKGGLPLSAAQPNPGLILKGQVYGSFGNWIAERISLDFIVTATGFDPDNPGNFVLNWSKGTPLSAALQQTLQTAFPGVKINMDIADYASPHTEIGYWSTPTSLARRINQLTQNQQGPNAAPIAIYWTADGNLLVTDNSNASKQTPKQIQYTDLIGQPTWIEPAIISIPVMLRADIQVGDVVQLPKNLNGQPGITATTPNVDSAVYNYPLTFRGNFVVRAVRQIGSFRGASGEDWMTVLECAALNPVAVNG